MERARKTNERKKLTTDGWKKLQEEHEQRQRDIREMRNAHEKVNAIAGRLTQEEVNKFNQIKKKEV